MADQEVKKKGFMRRLFDELDLWDVIAAITGGWLGARQHSPAVTNPPANPPPISAKQQDEGNFDCLLTVLAAGGSRGMVYADYVKGVHDACVSIHTDYGQEFRNYFFSMGEMSTKAIVEQLQKVLDSLRTMDSHSAWLELSKSSDFSISRTLNLCYEIEIEINKLHPGTMSCEEASKQAYLIIARRMIEDKRLSGTALVHAEARAQKILHGTKVVIGETLPKAEVAAKRGSKVTLIGLLVMILLLMLILLLSTCGEKPEVVINYQTGQASQHLVDEITATVKPTKEKE